MFRARCHLKSISVVSFGRRFEDKPDRTKEPWDYEKETWRKRLHVGNKGECFIPAGMFKNALINAARIKAEKIRGKGQNTYTSRFESGVVVENDLPLGIKVADVTYEDVFVPSDGKRGGTSPQVLKRFPVIESWEGWVTFTVILDDIITKAIFKRYLELAGQIAGVGRYRPERRGNKGRFSVEKIEFKEVKS